MTDYVIFDDYFCNYYTAQLSELILNNPKIVINDPRLCHKSRFNNVVKEIKKVLQNKEILYVFFENNKDQCLINAECRKDDKKGIEQHINDMSLSYNIAELVKLIDDAEYRRLNVYK